MNKEAEIRALLFPETGEAETPEKAEPETEPGQELESSEETQTDGVQETETDETEEPRQEAGAEEIADEDIVTIKSLAADLEIEPETLYGMRIPVDGHEPLTIGELKDLAQGSMDKREDAKQKETELAEAKAELERQQQQVMAQAEGIAPQELIKAEAELARVYSESASIDWPKLEAQNPGQAALYRQKLKEAETIATYNRDQIMQRMETTRSEIQAQRDAAMERQKAVAVETLHNLIPEWREETVFNREREHMVNKLVAAGVDENDVRALTSPTLVKYLRDSVTRDVKIDEAKPIQKPPKVLKAGAVRQAGIGKAKADERFYKQAAKSRDGRVKQQAIAQLLKASGV